MNKKTSVPRPEITTQPHKGTSKGVGNAAEKSKWTIKEEKNMCLLHRYVERVVLKLVYHHGTASISQQHVSGRIHQAIHTHAHAHACANAKVPRYKVQSPQTRPLS